MILGKSKLSLSTYKLKYRYKIKVVKLVLNDRPNLYYLVFGFKSMNLENCSFQGRVAIHVFFSLFPSNK